MTLINCRECKKEVSSSVNKCPQCGIKTPDEKKHNSVKRAAKLLLVIPAFLLLIVIGSIFSDNNNVPVSKPAYSSPSLNFIENNPELGQLAFPYIEESTGWAQGKRQWVTTDRGRYLFYLKGNEVVTVYISDENTDGGRREIWRKK